MKLNIFNYVLEIRSLKEVKRIKELAYKVAVACGIKTKIKSPKIILIYRDPIKAASSTLKKISKINKEYAEAHNNKNNLQIFIDHVEELKSIYKKKKT